MMLYKRCDGCGVVARVKEDVDTCPFRRWGRDADDKVIALGDCRGKLTIDTSCCHAVIFHGPGHQSTTRCQETGEHEIHRAVLSVEEASWRDMETCSGYFDEPPMED